VDRWALRTALQRRWAPFPSHAPRQAANTTNHYLESPPIAAFLLYSRRLIDHAPEHALRGYADGFMRPTTSPSIGLLAFRRQRAGEGNEIGIRQHWVEV